MKLPALLFTFLIFKESFSKQKLQTNVKSLLLKKLKKLLKTKGIFETAPQKNTVSRNIN